MKQVFRGSWLNLVNTYYPQTKNEVGMSLIFLDNYGRPLSTAYSEPTSTRKLIFGECTFKFQQYWFSVYEPNVSSSNSTGMKIRGFEIKNSGCEKLLRVKSDHKLNVNSCISDLRKKASCKINAVARVSPFMNTAKRRILLNAFFSSRNSP